MSMKLTQLLRKPSPPVIIAGLIIAVLLGGVAVLTYDRARNTEDTTPTILPDLPAGTGVAMSPTPTGPVPTISTEEPGFTDEVVQEDLTAPWDILFLDESTWLVSEKDGTMVLIKDGSMTRFTGPDDVMSIGEGGLTGLALDPEYTTNRLLYTCYNSASNDVRVVRFRFEPEQRSLTEKKILVEGIPSIAGGRHSGCQLEFGPDGFLWVGTGDAATAENPQDLQSLGGKILRIDRDGNPAYDNLQGGADLRVYSYGHRNVQGLGFFNPAYRFDAPGINIEHGSTLDDEVNPLVPGNFGWDPNPGYREAGVPMTDLEKFPDAVEAIWSSGNPTIATSGGTVINGEQWKSWNQSVAVGVQKDQHVLILKVNQDMTLADETVILKGAYGRIRTVQQGPDGNLYLLTDRREGSGADVIVRLSPNP
ncbi:MAG: Soluble aldose sugar dehydrogenase YliI precursor [candidate division WS6 bacterium OLB20]|uniref:Soluble aldose sugar dehydrogenase YliI n=1 Tax=candidate division WS6 bacterium OLB20 TaxID=1617426 RepID=A0A136LWP2_9BACT|nr:MAG: Soluble aldose sugar dehydrogenase YliI precursor [candidate division WS6 bacterium OLB20]